MSSHHHRLISILFVSSLLSIGQYTYAANATVVPEQRVDVPLSIPDIKFDPSWDDSYPEAEQAAGDVYHTLQVEFALQNMDYQTAANLAMNYAKKDSAPIMAMHAAQSYLELRAYKQAIEAAALYAKLNPADGDFLNYVLARACAVGYTEGVVPLLQDYLKLSKNKKKTLLVIGSILSRSKDKTQALVMYQEVLGNNYNNNYMANILLADFADMGGNSYLAYASAKKAFQLNPNGSEAIESLLNYSQNQNKSEALALVANFIKKHPLAQRERKLYIKQLYELKRFSLALVEVQSMRRHWPEDFNLLLFQARINYKLGHLSVAQKLFEEFISVQAQRLSSINTAATDAKEKLNEARLWLGYVHESQKKYDQAIIAFKQVDEASLMLTATKKISDIYLAQGYFQKAISVLQQYKYADDDERLDIVQSIGMQYGKVGRIDQAIRYLNSQLNSFDNKSNIQYDLALLYAQQGGFAKAESLLQEVISNNPDSASPYNALGYLLADQNKNLQLSELYLERAIALAPQDAAILDSMGWLQYRLGNYESAIEYLKKSLAIDPLADTLAHLAQVYWFHGQQDLALKMLKQSKALDSRNDTYLKTIKTLGVNP